MRSNYTKFFIVTLLSFATSVSLADAIHLSSKVIYGKITRITNDTVHYKEGCESNDVVSRELEDIESIKLTEQCDNQRRTARPIIFGSGLKSQCDAPEALLLVNFDTRSGKIFAYAKGINLKDTQASIQLYDTGLTYKGPSTGIKNIKPLRNCDDSVLFENELRIPSSFSLVETN